MPKRTILCKCALQPRPHTIAKAALAAHQLQLQCLNESRDVASVLTAVSLTDEGSDAPSKLWTSASRPANDPFPHVHSVLPPFTLADARQGAEAIMSRSSQPHPSTASLAHTEDENPNNCILKAQKLLELIDLEAQGLLATLVAQSTHCSGNEISLRLNTATQFLRTRSQALHTVTHAAVAAPKARVLCKLKEIGATIAQMTIPDGLGPEDRSGNAPVAVESPLSKNQKLAELDTIAQVTILLGVVCHAIIGLSTEPCNFIIGVVTMLIQLAMGRSSTPTFQQSHVIHQLPTSLYTATGKLNLEGKATIYATCPSCNFTYPPIENLLDNRLDYPTHCQNRIPGKEGLEQCGAELLHEDNLRPQPMKPFVFQSFRDYLANLLSDAEIERECDKACDDALKWQSNPNHRCTNNVFKGDFFRAFYGPTEHELFIDRRSKVRLAFIMHVDFFNPNGSTNRGNHDSIGVISLANLNLPEDIRNKPEFVYLAGIIPGPKEPTLDEISHFMKPIIDELEIGWNYGYHIQRTGGSPETGRHVEVAVAISTNDLPMARKISGTAGVGSNFFCTTCNGYDRRKMYNGDANQWARRDINEMRLHASQWRDAKTEGERDRIFKEHGVRWSELWRLPYWDPTRMLVVDSMHCVLEGLVHYHCRHVLALQSSSSSSSTPVDDPALLIPAFNYPWVEYDPTTLPSEQHMKTAHEERQIGAIQYDLMLPLGSGLDPTNGLRKKLSAKNKRPLRFVCQSLGLDKVLTPTILNGEQVDVPVPAQTKDYIVNLLVQWRLTMPCRAPSEPQATTLTLSTRTELLKYIQHTIMNTVTPSWVNSVPYNYGDSRAGTIKADEWRTLSTLYLPLALISFWNDDNGSAPPSDSPTLRILDHTMALFQAVGLLCRYTMTPERAAAYRSLLKTWVDDLHEVHPHTIKHRSRDNVHAAFHVYDFLLLFGPVASWWTFPFERMIGALQKIHTNDQIGGSLESTISSAWTRGANLRRWLRRPDCPEVIHQFRALFEKAFPSGHYLPIRQTSDYSGEVAHHIHGGKRYSRASTHLGNSNVIYYPTPTSTAPVIGSIQKIIAQPTGATVCQIQRYSAAAPGTYNPFQRYEFFPAMLYASTLDTTLDTIYFDAILSHASRFDISHNRSIFVNMSRA